MHFQPNGCRALRRVQTWPVSVYSAGFKQHVVLGKFAFITLRVNRKRLSASLADNRKYGDIAWAVSNVNHIAYRHAPVLGKNWRVDVYGGIFVGAFIYLEYKAGLYCVVDNHPNLVYLV